MNNPRDSAAGAMGATTRIVLAQEQAQMRDALKTLLSAQGGFEVVAETGDGRAVEALVRRVGPQLLLLDLVLPGLHGVEIAATLKAEFEESIKVLLLLTGDLQPQPVRQALASGADGCVHRSDDGDELLKAVHAVLGGRQYVSRRVAAVFVPPSLRLDAQGDMPPACSRRAPVDKT